jgi:hypothetical protein
MSITLSWRCARKNILCWQFTKTWSIDEYLGAVQEVAGMGRESERFCLIITGLEHPPAFLVRTTLAVHQKHRCPNYKFAVIVTEERHFTELGKLLEMQEPTKGRFKFASTFAEAVQICEHHHSSIS